MKKNKNKELENWIWTYQREGFGGWEWTCPHGVGHGLGVHGCEGCCGHSSFRDQVYPQIKTLIMKSKADNFEKLKVIKKYGLENVKEKEITYEIPTGRVKRPKRKGC